MSSPHFLSISPNNKTPSPPPCPQVAVDRAVDGAECQGQVAKAGAGKVVCRLCKGDHFTAILPPRTHYLASTVYVRLHTFHVNPYQPSVCHRDPSGQSRRPLNLCATPVATTGRKALLSMPGGGHGLAAYTSHATTSTSSTSRTSLKIRMKMTSARERRVFSAF